MIIGIIAIITAGLGVITNNSQTQSEEYKQNEGYKFIQSIVQESAKNKNSEQRELQISHKDSEKRAVIIQGKMKEIMRPYNDRKIKIVHEIG